MPFVLFLRLNTQEKNTLLFSLFPWTGLFLPEAQKHIDIYTSSLSFFCFLNFVNNLGCLFSNIEVIPFLWVWSFGNTSVLIDLWLKKKKSIFNTFEKEPFFIFLSVEIFFHGASTSCQTIKKVKVCLVFGGSIDADRRFLFEGITAWDCIFQIRVYDWKQLKRTLQGHLEGFSWGRCKHLYGGSVDSFSGHKINNSVFNPHVWRVFWNSSRSLKMRIKC